MLRSNSKQCGSIKRQFQMLVTVVDDLFYVVAQTIVIFMSVLMCLANFFFRLSVGFYACLHSY